MITRPGSNTHVFTKCTHSLFVYTDITGVMGYTQSIVHKNIQIRPAHALVVFVQDSYRIGSSTGATQTPLPQPLTVILD